MDENPYQSPRAIDAPTEPRVAYFHGVAREATVGAVACGAIFASIFASLVAIPIVMRGDELFALPAADIVPAIGFFCAIVIGSAVVGALMAAAWQVFRNIQARRDIRHVFETGQEN